MKEALDLTMTSPDIAKVLSLASLAGAALLASVEGSNMVGLDGIRSVCASYEEALKLAKARGLRDNIAAVAVHPAVGSLNNCNSDSADSLLSPHSDVKSPMRILEMQEQSHTELKQLQTEMRATKEEVSRLQRKLVLAENALQHSISVQKLTEEKCEALRRSNRSRDEAVFAHAKKAKVAEDYVEETAMSVGEIRSAMEQLLSQCAEYRLDTVRRVKEAISEYVKPDSILLCDDDNFPESPLEFPAEHFSEHNSMVEEVGTPVDAISVRTVPLEQNESVADVRSAANEKEKRGRSQHIEYITNAPVTTIGLEIREVPKMKTLHDAEFHC